MIIPNTTQSRGHHNFLLLPPFSFRFRNKSPVSEKSKRKNIEPTIENRLLFSRYTSAVDSSPSIRRESKAINSRVRLRRLPFLVRRGSAERRTATAASMLTTVLLAASMEGSQLLCANATTTLLLIGASCFILGYVVAAAASPVPARCVRSAFSWMAPFVSSRTTGDVYADADADKGNAKKKRQQESIAPLEIEKIAEILVDFKMVLVVRNDLKMGKGKIAAQCSHATLGLYKKLFRKSPRALDRWEMCGQAKVVLKCESEDDLLILQESAKSRRLPTHVTVDAGRTQIAPNSRTVMAILGPIDMVDDVTGGLKLL